MNFSPGRPSHDSAAACVEDHILADNTATVRQLSSTVGKSPAFVHVTLKRRLEMSKNRPDQVPSTLSDRSKEQRARICAENLALIKADPTALQRIISMDESRFEVYMSAGRWVHIPLE